MFSDASRIVASVAGVSTGRIVQRPSLSTRRLMFNDRAYRDDADRSGTPAGSRRLDVQRPLVLTRVGSFSRSRVSRRRPMFNDRAGSRALEVKRPTRRRDA
jgi:hypothetical protein